MTRIGTTTEEVVTADGLALRLSFEPQAIRDHFDSDDPNPTTNLTDEQLARVGEIALQDDRIYEAFHRALDEALREAQ